MTERSTFNVWRLAFGVWRATDPQGTFLFPIADHAADVLRITKVGLDAILLNGADAATTMKKANSEVNDLFN